MRDFENTGIHSPTGIRIDGHHNIVQMEVRNEKKDKIFMEQPQASQGEVATGQAPDLATRYSTIYEKPYQIPFSNISPQMPERSVGVKLGEGTAVPDIRPLTTNVYVNPLRNEPSKTDMIDVPTQTQDLTKSYGETPQPDIVTPTKPIPEATGAFETDPLYPAQTPEEYSASVVKQEIVYNKTTKKNELYEDGFKIRDLDMRTTRDKELYRQLKIVPAVRQSKKSILKNIKERRAGVGARPPTSEQILMSPEQITEDMPPLQDLETEAQKYIRHINFDA